MNQNQADRTTMFATVAAYMDKNKTLWTGIKATSDTVADMNAGIGIVATKAGKQQAPTGGAGDEKTDVRGDFEEKILEIGDQLAALASKTTNVSLAAQVDLTRSGVGKLPADDLENTGRRVSAAATANLTALADYGIVQADVTALDALTTRFHGTKTGPRMAIATRAAETATLPDAIDNVTTILRDRLDKQMTKFRASQPEFYAGYQSARVIVSRGGNGATPPAPAPAPVGPK